MPILLDASIRHIASTGRNNQELKAHCIMKTYDYKDHTIYMHHVTDQNKVSSIQTLF